MSGISLLGEGAITAAFTESGGGWTMNCATRQHGNPLNNSQPRTATHSNGESKMTRFRVP